MCSKNDLIKKDLNPQKMVKDIDFQALGGRTLWTMHAFFLM
jgi:hypothetical protein